MAHNLHIDRNGKASMFYVGDVPWHRLGRRLVKPATAAEAMVESGLDYKVVKRPLHTKLGVSQGHYSNLERGKRTISDDLLEKIAQVLGEQKDTVLSAVNLLPFESVTLKSWLSNVRINGLPFIKAFRYHMENAGLDVALMDNVGLKKELRLFIEGNIGFSLLAELSENKQLIEQIRSKLCGENIVKKESENIHEQPTGNE